MRAYFINLFIFSSQYNLTTIIHCIHNFVSACFSALNSFIIIDGKMYFLAKALMFHIFLQTAVALDYLGLTDGTTTTWDSFKLPFYDIFIEKDNHKLALLSWHDLMINYPFMPSLTIRTHYFNGQIDTKMCAVGSPYKDDNNWIYAHNVMFLKSDKVLISWKTDHKTQGLRISSQVISINTCKSSNFIDLKTEIDFRNDYVCHMVLRLKDSFDIIFKNEPICPNDYCKLSFDYNGEPLSTRILPFSKSLVGKYETLYINSLFTMEMNSGIGIVATGNKKDNLHPITNEPLASNDVYSPVLGWTKAEGLFDDLHMYTNSSGFATLCWFNTHQKKFCCKWLDGTHQNKNGLENILVLEVDKEMVMPWIANSPDGQIVIIKREFENNKRLFLVDKVASDGKCKRLMKIIHDDWPVHVKLSITEKNQLCFSFIVAHIDSNVPDKDPYIHTYSFITKCMNAPKDTVEGTDKCIKV